MPYWDWGRNRSLFTGSDTWLRMRTTLISDFDVCSFNSGNEGPVSAVAPQMKLADGADPEPPAG